MKTAIITGAARGLGAAMAKRMASLGYNIVIGDLENNAESANNVIQEAKEKYGVDGLAVFGDLSTYQGTKNLVDATIERFGEKIDVCINNIGICTNLPFVELKPEQYERVIQVNLIGYFHMCKQVVPYMIKANEGCIINVASVGGMMGVAEMADYCASKAGVIGLTRSLAVELGKYKIRVNAICPGNIMTDMLRGYDQDALQAYVDVTPLGKIGEPEDIAEAAEFIVKSGYLTGQSISPNGGILNP